MGAADYFLPGAWNFRCSICREEKDRSEFVKRNDCTRGYTYQCKKCQADRSVRWRKSHPGSGNKYRKKEQEKNKILRRSGVTRFKEASRRCYLKNRMKRLAYGLEYYRKNREAYVAKVAKRKSLKLRATPDWVDAKTIMQFYVEARTLSQNTGIKHHVDHIVPLKSSIVCGLHVPSNLQVVKASENWSKNNRYWPDMPE